MISLPQVRSIRTYSKNANLVREKRELIANKALKLFLEKGYAGTTIRQLAEACDLTEGAIYRYIGSKDDILHLFLLGIKVNQIQDFLTRLGDVSTTEALKQCICQYYLWQDQTREINIFYNREIANFTTEDRGVLLKSQSDYINFFEILIQKGIDAGIFKTSDPKLVAHNIVMLGWDWGMRKWYLKRWLTIDQYIEKQTAMFLFLLTGGKG
ncbi:MAG: TetR/AcrR family transcriptional regulator [Dehalococcoidales bacterium]|nr:TetR/AcrR family transcriptional regulator [Dehalococcoidales bacterium]